ncbi:unnamed protein product [Cyclocybe aegerita]|uniref:Protein kinase domain-containing protein n=1 Tax=Cyclocybe aegerita TaxID=1973307 RepID=A0A8S0XNM2_CYCAE|nr:unnamed protein product [Cyclocybe aegerita]
MSSSFSGSSFSSYLSLHSTTSESVTSMASTGGGDKGNADKGNADKIFAIPVTPSKSKVAKENPRRAETARKILKLELDGHLYQDITVEQFVINVWGLDEATVRRVLDANIGLHKSYWRHYKAVCNKPSQSQPEQHLHEPFRHISSHLLKDVCKKLGLDPKKTIKDAFWDGGGSKNMKSRYAYGRLRKPDLLRIWGLRDGRKRPRWSETKSALEFKVEEAKRRAKKNPNGGYTYALQSIQEGTEIAGIATPQSGASSSFATSSRGTGSGSRAQSFSTPLTSYADLSLSTTFKSSTSSKRLFDEVDGRDADDGANPPKRAKVAADDGDEDEEEEDEDEYKKPEIEVKNGEIQLATYALECLGDSSRHYTTGIFIDSTSVNLWYYDRSAVIRASKFEFSAGENNHGTKLLAVALFALSQATMKQSGFDPFVHRFIEPKNGVVLQEHHIKAITIPLSIRSKTCFRFNKNGEDLIFVVDKVLYTYSSIIGRGTYVASGKQAYIGSPVGEIPKVLKLSWQLQVRHAEAELLRRIRGRLPDYWHRHLPAVRFSAVYKPEELGLPRSKLKEVLKPTRKEIQERDLHVLVTDLYHKLHEAADIEEFKRIFLDCLECHYHTYTTGRVLHRDISENNLMFADPKEVTAPTGATDWPSSRWGILNDFDLGSEIDADGNVQSSNANHRTGTLPYMATDLISRPVPRNPHVQYVPPSHYYRHDLESFFYILVFASTRYTFDKGKCLPVPACLAEWTKSDTAYNSKCGFFTPSGLQHVNAAILDHFTGLWDEWIIPLYAMFMKARNDVPGIWEPEYKEYDFVTFNNRITFEQFMAAIKVKPRNSDGKRPL